MDFKYFFEFRDPRTTSEWTRSNAEGLEQPYSNLSELLTDLQFLDNSPSEKNYDYRIVREPEAEKEVLQ